MGQYPLVNFPPKVVQTWGEGSAGLNARRCIEEHCSLMAIVARHENLCEDLAARVRY